MAKREETERVRGGGRETAAGYRYELSGGALCLDFANTVDSRPTESPRELIGAYGELVEWALQADAVTSGEAKALRVLAARHPRQAQAALRRGRALREALFGIFSPVARGEAAPAAALRTFNAQLPAAFERLRVERMGSRYAWAWEEEPSLDRVLWPVVRSAAELLTSERIERVRECAADDCAWLFLDQSRNRSRRWCDMTVCGNRSKVRRYREAQDGD